MDKREFNIKVEQIKKRINEGDYKTAMKIADAIDWRRVRSTNLLSMVTQIYEKNEEYGEAKNILLLAFERAPAGKRLLYKLTDLALKENNIEEAEDYYREFCNLASEDSRQHLLRYNSAGQGRTRRAAGTLPGAVHLRGAGREMDVRAGSALPPVRPRKRLRAPLRQDHGDVRYRKIRG